MRSRLDEKGRLIPPTSPQAAQLRQQQLAYEIARIRSLLAEQGEAVGDRGEGWRRRTQGQLGWLTAEERQLLEWMRSRGVETLSPRTAAPTPRNVAEGPEDYAAFWKE